MQTSDDREKALLFFEEGNKLKQAGQLSEAVGKYQEALDIDPNYAPALNQLGDIHETRKEFDRALVYYQRFVLAMPSNGLAHAKVARMMLYQKDIEGAITNYQKAIALQPEQPAWVYKELGDALVENGQADRAIDIYQKLIDSGEKVPPTTYKKLGDLLQEKKKAEQALAAYEKALELNPNQPKIYLTIAQVYFKKGNLDAVIDSYQKALKLNPDFSYGIYKKLEKALKLQKRGDEAKTWLELAPRSQNNNEAFYAEIWQSLNQTSLASLEENSCNYPIKIAPQEVEKYFAQTINYKVIDLNQIEEGERQFLETNGLSLTYLKLNKARSISKEEISLEEDPDPKQFKRAKKVNQLLVTADRRTDYQQSLVDSGYICAVCPSSGRILTSNRSFCVFHNMGMSCYRFVGEEVFYLMMGTAWNERCSIYFPGRELLVHLTDTLVFAPDAEKINAWKASMVSNWQTVKSYLAREKQDAIVAITGFTNNLGHHLWNELSGIQRSSDFGNINKIDRFIVAGLEVYASLEEIFPEIPPEKIERVGSQETNIDREILEKNYLAFRPAYLSIAENLADRIYQASLKKCSPEILTTIDRAKQHFPLLWITIRLNNRTWVEQIEGLAKVITALASDFPNLGVVFDGVSRVCNRDGSVVINQKEEETIKQERETVSNICALLPKEITVYNTVGCLMHESIAWAKAIDLYLSPYGAGLSKVTWIANKPGIIHTNKRVLQKPIYKRVYAWERENGIVPTFISEQDIIDVTEGVQRKSLSDTRHQLNNYNCGWQIIYQETLKLVRSLKNN
jgi:tetratricopeptide (TPR) repeat protein